MGFKSTVFCKLSSIERKVNDMSEVIDNFVTGVNAAFDGMKVSLTNIAADEDRLAKQITALFQQIADIIAAGGTLSDADLEKLTVLGNKATEMAASTKAIADAVPDPPPPPPAG